MSRAQDVDGADLNDLVGFKNLVAVHDHYPELMGPWEALRDVRAERRAADWLAEQGLIDEAAAQQFAADHPDPDFP